MAFIVQNITFNGESFVKKEREQSLNNRCLTLKITAPEF